MKSKFGEYLKKLRIQKGITLRKHCKEQGFDPGNYSRMERGLYSPPGHEILEKYSVALDVKEGSEEWLMLFDLAAAAKGELPKDLLSDEELVEKLPVLFRTLRAESVSEDRLDDLIEKVRKS